MRLITLSLIVLAASAGGCLEQGSMTLPKDFVAVDKAQMGSYDVRAVSADGVVVGVRRQANTEGGSLNFWSEASMNELKSQGYRPVGKVEDVQSSSGTPGRLMEFAADQRGTTFTYLLAIYATSKEVVLAEAGGRTDDLKKYRDDIRKSLLSAR